MEDNSFLIEIWWQELYNRYSPYSEGMPNTGGGGAGACFVAGTLIKTKDGFKAIEEVKVGDEVYSEDPETGEKGLKKVINTFIHDKSTLLNVYIGEIKIETTEEHPFWVVRKGWVFAGALNVGDKLLLNSDEIIAVTKLETINLEKPVKVYNFEVDDWHTYFVSGISILVHNKAARYRPPNLSPEGAGRNGAFREAKRNSGIPVNEQPIKVEPAKDRNGKPIPGGGRDYYFKDGKVIREHYEHTYPDDPYQNRGTHFNDMDKNHYDY